MAMKCVSFERQGLMLLVLGTSPETQGKTVE